MHRDLTNCARVYHDFVELAATRHVALAKVASMHLVLVRIRSVPGVPCSDLRGTSHFIRFARRSAASDEGGVGTCPYCGNRFTFGSGELYALPGIDNLTEVGHD